MTFRQIRAAKTTSTRQIETDCSTTTVITVQAALELTEWADDPAPTVDVIVVEPTP